MTGESKKEKRIRSYQRYRRVADRTGKSDYQVSKEAGFHNVIFSDWKYGRCEPKVDKLLAISKVLNVSIDELIEEKEG